MNMSDFIINFMVMVMAIIPDASSASDGPNSQNRVYEATYVNFAGEYLYFEREILEDVVNIERIEDSGIPSSLCSTETFFCVGRITLPSGDVEENMKWQAHGTTYFSGQWRDFYILGKKHSLITITSGKPNLEGVSVPPYKYLYSKTIGVVAIEIPFSDAKGNTIYKVYVLSDEKGLGAKKEIKGM